MLIVGVGGGIPHYANAARHVRLGDVVVSSPTKDKAAYVFCDHLQINKATKAVCIELFH